MLPKIYLFVGRVLGLVRVSNLNGYEEEKRG